MRKLIYVQHNITVTEHNYYVPIFNSSRFIIVIIIVLFHKNIFYFYVLF